MVGWLFPGQGVQYKGMGKDLFEAFLPSRDVFRKADEILEFSLSKLCFEGPEDELTRTDNCQVAVLTASIACLRILEKESLVSFIKPAFIAGLSLGEYTALIASGSLTFEEGLRLVRKRAQLMEEASRNNPGKMVAVLGLSLDIIKKICQESGTQIANINCPSQVVISGMAKDVDNAVELANKNGAKKTIALSVSGAFHSYLMEGASYKLQAELVNVQINPPKFPVISNVTAKPQSTAQEIKDNLFLQLKSTVLWEDSINFMKKEGVKTFFEIGPGSVLKGLLKNIDPKLRVYNIEKAGDILALKHNLKKR